MSRTIEDLLPADLTPAGLEALREGEPFRSRKNRVFRIRLEGRLAVAKIYAPERVKLAESEYHILDKCHREEGRAPRPLAVGNGTIVMEYVDGENLSEKFDRLWRDDDGSKNSLELRRLVTDGLAEWLAQFHRIFGLREARGDTILRNFIVSESQIYGLDFEEAMERDPLSDLGEACANMLSMHPMFTPGKLVLARELAERYWHHSGTDRSAELQEAIAVALEHYSSFRADGDSMRTWARKIRIDGLSK